LREFDLQGHRGARGLFPENTLEGFAATLAIGVHSIEFDVGVTADGVPVVIHDQRLNPATARGPDGTWLNRPGPAVRSLTCEQLRHFDVGRLRPGSAYALRFAAQVPRDGARIPTLAEALSLTAGADVSPQVELKTAPGRPGLSVPPEDMADLVAACADAADAAASIVVRSFDWRGLRHLRSRRPDIALAWLTDARTTAAAARWWGGWRAADFGGSVPCAVAAAAGEGPSCRWTPVWAPDYRILTPALLAEAHDLGLRVIPWTVNAPRHMVRLIAWGVDGLCTDRPDLAHAVMQAAALPLPPPFLVSVANQILGERSSAHRL
jgi:glycerophosphoryl diester phosphodiesterase